VVLVLVMVKFRPLTSPVPDSWVEKVGDQEDQGPLASWPWESDAMPHSTAKLKSLKRRMNNSEKGGAGGKGC
jgi:hypothetical protein